MCDYKIHKKENNNLSGWNVDEITKVSNNLSVLSYWLRINPSDKLTNQLCNHTHKLCKLIDQTQSKTCKLV